MYVCICAAVTDRQLKQAARDGACTLDDLAVQLGVGAGCGCCREVAQELLDSEIASPVGPPVLHAREVARVAVSARRV